MLKAYLQISKLNEKGQLINKGRKKLSRSFVRGFIFILGRQFAQSVAYSTNDIDNTAQNHSAGARPLYCNGGGGNGDYSAISSLSATASPMSCLGVVVGTGTVAVTSTDVALAGRILHGTGAVNLEYFGNMISGVSITNSKASFDVERIFRNSGGANIAISEAGIYANHVNATSPFAYCIARDVLVSTVTVLTTEYLKVKYTLSIIA